MLSTGREAEIAGFLTHSGWSGAERAALAGDASARRYERLRLGGRRAVLMDAAGVPDQVVPFMTVRDILASAGLSAPAILAADPARALLLLEDFGDATFTALLEEGAEPGPLYRLATSALVHLHRSVGPDRPELARYDIATWIDIVGLFADHYVPRHGTPADSVARAEFDAIWRALLRPLTTLPESLLLRDFHAGNLFRLTGREGAAACGLIDFQDAGIGSVLYDLISLLEDARRDLAPGIAATCLADYRAAFPDLDGAAMDAAWHALALQRHLRVIAVFDRLAANGDERYLVHMPRLWRYVGGHLAGLGDPALERWLRHHLPVAPWT